MSAQHTDNHGRRYRAEVGYKNTAAHNSVGRIKEAISNEIVIRVPVKAVN